MIQKMDVQVDLSTTRLPEISTLTGYFFRWIEQVDFCLGVKNMNISQGCLDYFFGHEFEGFFW